MIDGDPAKALQMVKGSYDANMIIGCASSACLFVQKTNQAVSGSTVIKLLRILKAKCKRHGSIPLRYSVASNGTVSGNDYRGVGELTVNAIPPHGSNTCEDIHLDNCIWPPPGHNAE